MSTPDLAFAVFGALALGVFLWALFRVWTAPSRESEEDVANRRAWESYREWRRTADPRDPRGRPSSRPPEGWEGPF